MRALTVLGLVLLSRLSFGAPLPKLLVMPLTTGGGVESSVAQAFTEAVTAEVGKKGFFDALSQKEIGTLMGVERQKQLLGCSEDGGSCLTELAGAMGTRFIMTGQVAKLGEAYQLTLQVLDSQKAQPLGRSTRIAKSVDALRSAVPWAVAEATATPAPKPPSKVPAITLLSLGGAAIVGGGLWGLMALNEEARYEGELKSGEAQAGVLKEQQFYLQQAERLGLQKTVSLAVMGGGLALMVVGFILMPSDAASGGSVAFVPTFNGGALVGSF